LSCESEPNQPASETNKGTFSVHVFTKISFTCLQMNKQ
jgi:hypothetical protein